MSLLDVFNATGTSLPSATDIAYEGTYTPYTPIGKPADECIWDWELSYNATRQNQIFQNSNVGGFISPYQSHWTGPVTIMGNMEELIQFQPVNKIDPNKIYNTDIAALRAIEQDQLKIVKLFETRLKESLNERGKIGLTEEDIEAMQALTAARTAVANIHKEQINIKKNISDTKIKQYQLEQADNKAIAKAQEGTSGGGGGSVYDVGRSILDNIFDSALPIPPASSLPSAANPSNAAIDAAQASSVLDSLIGGDNIPATTRFETMNPTTYVRVGTSDSDTSFETYAEDGTLLIDYPNPTARITHVDREAGTATDEFLVTYQLKTDQPTGEETSNES